MSDDGYTVARGKIASLHIGVEVKILAKAMIKQIDRVISDLKNQVVEMKRGGGRPICIGIVGVNFAEVYTSYEGKRRFQTTGTGSYRHPAQEAQEAKERLVNSAKPAFDEFLILPFRASNEKPYPFSWVDLESTERDYAAMLVRVSREYEVRF